MGDVNVQGQLVPSRSILSQATPLIVITVVIAVGIHFGVRIIQFIIQRRKDNKLLKDFPGPPPHWLYGNLRQFKKGEGIYRQVENSADYGGIYTTWIGPFWVYIVLGHSDFVQVLLGSSEPKDPIGYRFVQQWIGDGLLISQGKKWARNRRLLTPSFHFDILKPYQDLFSNCANVMCEKWRHLIKEQDDNSVEMFEHVSLMTLDSLMKCIFGIDSNFQNEKKRNPYINCVYEISELITKRFRFFPHHSDWIYYFSPNGYKFRKAVKYTQDFTRSVINKKKKEKESQTVVAPAKKYLDFLEMLLDCRDADGQGLSLQEVQDEVDTFMFEGHDTTASGISWILYNLAAHPEFQARARAEVNDVLGDRNVVSWNDVGQLEYLTMCIKESLRTHPPVPNVGRVTTKPLTFKDGRTIPEGTWIGIAIYACHHNPQVWNDPEVYDPERFTVENSKDRHSHAFVPFSAGPRNCIGQHFAMNELKTCVALVLKNFELALDLEKPAIKMPELVLRSKNGLYLKLTPINN